jgi:hypothetical protein
MNRRIPPLGIVIAVLLVIGILASMRSFMSELLLAVIVFGGVFLLWKYPPARWRRPRARRPTSTFSRPKQKDRRKRVPFKVIQGSKRDDDDEPDKPHMYH